MKKILSVSLLLLFAGLVQAQQRYELTVKEAVDAAFKNVIELKNAQIDYQIQEAKNREILGQAYPQISGNVAANHYLKLPGVLFPQSEEGIYTALKRENLISQSTSAPPPVLVPFSFQQPWNLSAGATLMQLLFQPDVFVGLQARQTALDYSSALIEQTKEKIKDSAYKRYYAILIAEKQLFFIDDGLKRLAKLYRDDSIMYVNGFAERLELDKVQVQINNLQSTRNNIAVGVELAYAALKFAIGVSQKDVVVLKDDLSTANIKDNILNADFKYEDRVEIRTLSHVKKLQGLDLKRNQLGYIPTVSAMANYSANGQGQNFYTSGSTTWINSAYIGLNINVPIFDGLQRKYKVKQSQLKLQQVDNSIDNVKQAIDFEQVVTKQMLLSALSNLDIQEKNMKLAEKVYNTTKIKFEEGLTTFSTEVLLAENDLQASQSNYFTALYNAVITKISYQRSLGKLE